MKTFRKIIIYSTMIICFVLLSCMPTPPKNRPALDEDLPKDSVSKDEPIKMGMLFTLEDAEKIVGEPVHWSDSSTSYSRRGITYQSSYEADEKDSKSKKTGNVYFLVTKFENIDSAKQEYVSIMEANRKNGIEELKDLGDQAYFHTDKENFYFIMVQKGYYSFRIKVNKLTS